MESQDTKAGRKLNTWQDLSAGGIAGLVARMCIAPLDVLKIRMQVQPARELYTVGAKSAKNTFRADSTARLFRQIVQHEGFYAFWQGNIPALCMVVPFSSIQFAVVGQVRPWLAERSIVEPYSTVVSSIFAGTLASGLTYPLDLLRTRLAAQKNKEVYAGVIDAAVQIAKTQGFRGFYAGVGISVVEVVPYAVIGFTSFDVIKAWWLDRVAARDASLVEQNNMNTVHATGNGEEKAVPIGQPMTSFVDEQKAGKVVRRKELHPMEGFFIGAISGLIVKVILLPFDNIKLRLQVQKRFFEHTTPNQDAAGPVLRSARVEKPPLSAWQMITKMWVKEGLRAFYRGVVPTMLKTIPNSALHFGVYEYAKQKMLGSNEGFV